MFDWVQNVPLYFIQKQRFTRFWKNIYLEFFGLNTSLKANGILSLLAVKRKL